ncbi:hypothetical protein [Streptomyces sp. DSM 15324]|uniref:hypothetical protein n=1 Tax=Streptomyces sp. DSM 15324 TaxID=1739111 RepID=UPI00082EA267|nr:hypothetical protein [Streptomyces sp. DSM 15324]
MVTSTHEASHRLFQEHPEALTHVFEALGIPPPSKADFGTLSPDTTEIQPLERRVDTVLKFEPEMGESFLLAIEAQTKPHPEKGKSWAYYVAHLRAKYDMPVLLVAVCKDRPTANWAAGPFECVVGSWTTQITRPFVLGPTTVPEITDEATVARNPAVAALAAIVHSENRRAPAILETLARGLLSLDPLSTAYWTELVEVGLENTPIREKWKTMMDTLVTHFPGHRTMFEEKYLKGKAEGAAKDRASLILRVLDKHGIEVSDSVRERITSCADLDTLTVWFDRALSAVSVQDLFADESDGPATDGVYQEALVRGEARGAAAGVLRVLEVRGLVISEHVRERITTCTDLARVDDWLERAGTVEKAEELFAEV